MVRLPQLGHGGRYNTTEFTSPRSPRRMTSPTRTHLEQTPRMTYDHNDCAVWNLRLYGTRHIGREILSGRQPMPYGRQVAGLRLIRWAPRRAVRGIDSKVSPPVWTLSPATHADTLDPSSGLGRDEPFLYGCAASLS